MQIDRGQTYQFELIGKTPLLHHKDDVEAADELSEWRKHPDNANLSKPGDDRSPPWTWQTYLYHDGEHLCLPFENLSACLMLAGARVTLKGTKTFKELTQSGIGFPVENFPLLVAGKQVALTAIEALTELSFAEQSLRVKSLGFRLWAKRARVGQRKHVRVRARFDSWSITGSLNVIREEITRDALETILEIAGTLGLCDWRPGSPRRPGPYGQFGVKLRSR